MCDELFEFHKDKALDRIKFVFTDPHDYLMLNVDSQSMYKGFDQVMINNKDDEN